MVSGLVRLGEVGMVGLAPRGGWTPTYRKTSYSPKSGARTISDRGRRRQRGRKTHAYSSLHIFLHYHDPSGSSRSGVMQSCKVCGQRLICRRHCPRISLAAYHCTRR